MKTGRTLNELAETLTNQQQLKRDFVLASSALEMITEDGKSRVQFETDKGLQHFWVKDLAHEQIADKLGIPMKYYRRMMAEAPILLDDNVNQWLKQGGDKQMQLLRTMDGHARAFLSNKYRPLDNYDLAEIALPELSKMEARVISCEVTDTNLYIKAVTEKIQYEVPKVGDLVQAGIAISNSEVGKGRLSVKPLIYTLRCTNGMICETSGFKTNHVGKGLAGDEESYEFFKDETRLADDRAMWLKVRDTIANAMNQISFEGIVNRMGEAFEDKIEGNPVKVLEVAQKHFVLNDGERDGVLVHLLKGNDLSRYGLLNAVTRYSQDVSDYDRCTDFERMGNKVLEISRKDWKEISTAV